MNRVSALNKRLFVSLCALTRTTDRFARTAGVGYFLPALFTDRFANLGGIDKALFASQLDGCRSFEDGEWADYWRRLAQPHLDSADDALGRLGVWRVAELMAALNVPTPDSVADKRLQDALAPAVEIFAERCPENTDHLLGDFLARHADRPAYRDAAVAIDELVKAMTYLFAASWPGWSPQRLRAYLDSQRIFTILLTSLAPAMGVEVERMEIQVGDEVAVAYGLFPVGGEKVVATVLTTNGLEGTIQEALLPLLRYRHSGLGHVIMEMPGTYSYRHPMSDASEDIYRGVIDHLLAHPRVDGQRLAMASLSFGAYWSTRLAAGNPRVRAVVSNGGPYHRSFQASAGLGMPEIMLWTLRRTVGATSTVGLTRKLRALSVRHLYPRIDVPVLAINGDRDTLISTRDTVDLAHGAPTATLLLYPDDDHCAMGHYSEWLRATQEWLQTTLAQGDRRLISSPPAPGRPTS